MDIYISYKRDYSADLASNLAYRLSVKRYDVFFDLESMGRGDYRTQIYSNIDQAKDVLIIIHPNSFCNAFNGHEDWFLIEVEYALKQGKNIIPILTSGADQNVLKNTLPKHLNQIAYINSPKFNLFHINDYLALLNQKFLLSKPKDEHSNSERCSINFYADEDCALSFKGRIIGYILANSDDPLCFNLDRFGQFFFEATSANRDTKKVQITIRDNEELIHQFKFKVSPKKPPVSTIVFAALWLATLPFIFTTPFFKGQSSPIPLPTYDNKISVSLIKTSVQAADSIWIKETDQWKNGNHQIVQPTASEEEYCQIKPLPPQYY